MPQPELLETYLRKPITLVPDTTGQAENYARKNELDVEKILPSVGVRPEYLYQAERYRSSMYAEGIKTALEHKEEIKAVLNYLHGTVNTVSHTVMIQQDRKRQSTSGQLHMPSFPGA